MKKRILALALTAALILGGVPVSAAGTTFTDVPAGSWAESSISQAVDLGIIGGYGPGIFGYGDQVTRGQFAAMLVRLFKWEKVVPEVPAFTDNSDKGQWYYSEIETAAAHGAILTDQGTFRPEEPITREEMAVMLVRALGYGSLASDISPRSLPFTDVSNNRNAIALAYDFGLISGVTPTAFDPAGKATREQAAAMMIRLHSRYTAKLQWLHGFYAISSYAQKDVIPRLDALSFGWSRLQYTAEAGVDLNMTTSGNNEYAVPAGYTEVVELAKGSGVPANLNVIMTTSQQVQLPDGTLSNACREILLNPENRTAAIAAIMNELTREGNYAGVTIDFEGMKGPELKAGLVQFLQTLRLEADKAGKTVFVCVPPATRDGIYFDAYDYRAIGQSAHKVILMAHDYQATSLTPQLMSMGFTTTPQTPIYDINYALEAITDKVTGVEDTDKIALALSLGSVGWSVKDGVVINERALRPAPATIYSRLADPATTLNYSEKYQNPYLTFRSEAEGTDTLVWYEDQRSVAAKVKLARMFGINSISIWRLGLVADYQNPAGREIHYDILSYLMNQK